MAAAAVVIGWVGVGLKAYNMYKYLFSHKKQTESKYNDGALQTKIDNTAAVPLIYGTVKSAGNLIYTRMSGDKKWLYKLVSFSLGPIEDITEIKFNDRLYTELGSTGAQKYMGDGNQSIDSTVVAGDTYTQVRTVGSLKREAYLATWAKASEELGGSYEVTAVIKGRKVRCYSREKKQNSTFHSEVGYYYTFEFSDNPAWCLLDFLTFSYGCGVSYSEIDLESFLECAAYYDEPPLTKGQPKRFTLNLRIDEKRSKVDWIMEMLMTCQSYPTYQNGKIGIMVEKKEPISQVFYDKEIHDLNIWWSSSDEIADIARIGYIEPEQEWTKIYAQAEADSFLRPSPYIKDVDIVGVTNYNQASRLSWFYLNQSITCTEYISFITDRRALNRSIGDVIELRENYITALKELDREGKRYRIIKMVDNQDGGIELHCREYNPYIYDDMLGNAPPIINSTDLPSIFDPVPDILGFKEGIKQVYYVQKDKSVISYITARAIIPAYPFYYQLRILYQEVGEDAEDVWHEAGTSISGEFTINNVKVSSTYRLLIYLENTNAMRSRGYLSEDIYITGYNAPPETPTGFKADEIIDGFKLTWNPNTENDIEGYNVYEGNSPDPTYIVLEKYPGTTYNYNVTRTGQFVFWLRAVDTTGNLSGAAMVVTSKIPPKPVQGFDVYQNGRNLEFKWKQNDNEKVRVSYEIRKGESWDMGILIGRTQGTQLTINYYSTSDTHKFWIKALSFYGAYSETASYATIDISEQPNRNMVYTDRPANVENGWNGSMTNVDIIDRGLRLKPDVMFGEAHQREILPERYVCRSWIDCELTGVKVNDIRWKDALFSWDIEGEAGSSWLPFGSTENAVLEHAIARKLDENPTDIIESIDCNGNINPLSGSIIKAIKPTYKPAKFFKGTYLGPLNYIDWKVNFPKEFSMCFNLKMEKDFSSSAFILSLLTNDNKYLKIYYSKIFNEFCLTDGKNEIRLKGKFATVDILTFTIIQESNLRTFCFSSFSKGIARVQVESLNLAPIGVFTKISTYATI